jgi:putative zinc finger protein
MKHNEDQHPHELISAFSDQVATPEEASRLQEHLQGCAECRQLLHDINRLVTAVGEEAVPAPPLHLAEKIRMRIESGDAPRPAPAAAVFWRSPFPLAAAATLLMATTIWLAWRREVTSPNPSTSQTLQAPTTKNEPGRVHAEQPAPAVAPPVIANRDMEKTEPPARELRSLGYVGTPKGPSAPSDAAAGIAGDESAPSTTSTPPARVAQESAAPGAEPDQAAAVPGSESQRGDYLDLITSSGLTGEDYKKAKERKAPAGSPPSKEDSPAASGYSGGLSAQAMKESSQVVSAEGTRSLAYEGPRFSATFNEDGLVTLIARGYACSVTVPMPPSGEKSGGARSRTIEDLPGLFAVAASRDFLAAGSTGESSQKPPAAPASGATSSLTLRNGEGDPIHSVPFAEPLPQEAPQVLRTLRQGIQSLIQQRYRKNLETRCGPLPEALLSNP